MEPSGRFLYTVTLASPNEVWAHSIDAETGHLTRLPEGVYRVPSSPSAAVEPTGRYVYLPSNGINGYAINATTGALSPVPGAPFAPGNWRREVACDPTGRFVYATAPGSHEVSSYRINGYDGSLQMASVRTVGDVPVGVATEPSGRFVYVANRLSNSISPFVVDETTGVLTHMSGGAVATAPGPFAVAVTNFGRKPAALRIEDVVVVEGSGGTRHAMVPVTLLPRTSTPVSVQYFTVDGAAKAGSDYEAVAGTLTLSPGSATAFIPVPITTDPFDEDDEAFYVELSAATVDVARGRGTVTIADDDPTPSLSVNDVTLIEGNSGTADAIFTLSLTAASGRSVTVRYATGDGTATGGVDYVATAGTLSFPPGTTTRTIRVRVLADKVNEATEAFSLNLSEPVNVTLSDSQGVVTIMDDDPQGLSVSDLSVVEPKTGTASCAFTVALAPTSDSTVTADWATVDGTATAAGGDYVARSGTLSFAAGEATKQVSITVNSDAAAEGRENFSVQLSNPSGGTPLAYGGTGTCVIRERRTRVDYDGDDKGDVLLYHAGIGQVYMWQMDGSHPALYNLPGPALLPWS